MAFGYEDNQGLPGIRGDSRKLSGFTNPCAFCNGVCHCTDREHHKGCKCIYMVENATKIIL
ncbi:hypothetical protein Pmar_PMAR016386 [Perkinsus marinus ATCC 50983]|uniref:Uncharacterized protein n=1 Tax=Perkinsus marinus (strain ATCC 50983 / TXsc) TaxID=423536 RepID=C5L8I2_PERM5|nr:hypothetical protein Pmar_PMAR016386 [Perkinsus marinus ATCC 50983]EER06971.1 hypothetical protein Pmar_PMAR016386 [Perkinsus marinus ATCC 50983]|eukprot:XP_002775155.1 hypothetical protein Pmar_PMAR016386 [Perkinsus marinus ATCC 50983]